MEDLFTRRFQHLIDASDPDAQAAAHEQLARLTWQPGVALATFRLLQPLAVAGQMDCPAVLSVAAAVGKAEHVSLAKVLAAIFVVPEKLITSPFADLPGLPRYVSNLAAFLAGASPSSLPSAVNAFIRPSISSFNAAWQPLMANVLCGGLFGVADVLEDKAEARCMVAMARGLGIDFDTPDLFIDKDGRRVAHVELKGTSERNQGDSATDRVIRDSNAFRRIPEFSGRRYVAFISGKGYYEREYVDRLDAYNDPLFVLVATDAEAAILRGLGSKRVVALSELPALVATW